MTQAPYTTKATTPQFLRYLLALDQAGSFRAAAELASVSQPTLSNAIQNWERAMGVILFERGARGASPTPMGLQIIQQARQTLDSLEHLERLASVQNAPFFGPIRVGMIPTVGPYAMPFVHEAVRLAYPDLSLEPEEGKTEALIHALEHGGLDMIMLAELPYMKKRFTVAPLYNEPFILAMPQSHQLAKRKTVHLTEIDITELLLLNEGHCLRDQALELCTLSVTDQHQDRYRTTSLETLCQLVAVGYGITLLPILATRHLPKAMRTCRLESAPARQIVFIWRHTDPRSAAYEELIDAIRYSVPADLVTVCE